jgi:uncharacterized protein YecE (DUF72 family)
LRFYAQEFGAVEINATYYRIPAPSVFRGMVAKTPPSFRFMVKAHQDMTHKRHTDPDLYRTFRAALQPLLESGRLTGVLLQFPFGFKRDARALAHLEFLRRRLDPLSVWAEFRHASWDHPQVYAELRRLNVGFCAVDEPALPGMMPPVAEVTNGVAYVRFHGRNAATWYGGGHERYDWEYSRQELESWLDRLRSLADASSHAFLFFNNCYMGRAVTSARLMGTLLGIPSRGPLELF